MKKNFLIVFLILISTAISVFAYDDVTLRGYTPIEVPKGTFVQVINLQEFSTSYCDDSTRLKFATTDNTYMYDTIIIPKDTVVYGVIDKMNEPVVGTNASMVVKLTKMELPDGFEIPIKAFIYTKNGNLIGGEVTQPASYKKLPHYQWGMRYGTLQWVPGPALKMGEHVTVASGAMMMVVFDAPAYITHTLTN